MEMPGDINILVSMVNMKLRDGGYASPEDLCLSEGWDADEFKSRMSDGGFVYMPEVNQFR
ncbi:MAG: DUF4250 domain-containing protein [Muribaculaceae bacterium]|nr:DUF4250 domain-containing protein [Muribaculaceae bacterium]